ncbi:MAG TPA: glycosyltransferase family 87 protein [Candidatus Sulfomarinibacteraceae bacterium]|nr:glycosyltransferase family 87 protein [Candidatus Sulfomarinibacteraceae bacterium]
MAAQRLDLGRLASAAFVVLLAVFVGLRALDVDPWAMPAYDVYAYWATRDGFDYSTARQGATGAYLYSPAFAQLIWPLAALPWPIFAGVWTALIAAPLLWLAGRHAVLLVVLPPVFMSIALGQLDLPFAVIAIVGLRWPMAWALPILTKVTPGVGLVWFLVRGEWRSLGLALGATLAITAASVGLDPAAWRGWLGLLSRMEFPALGGGLWFLPIPLGLRLVGAVALIAWGAATDRRWVLPVGVWLSVPTIWLNSPTILIALLPFAAAGAATPAGAWLRANLPASDPFGTRRRVRAWLRRAPV